MKIKGLTPIPWENYMPKLRCVSTEGRVISCFLPAGKHSFFCCLSIISGFILEQVDVCQFSRLPLDL